MTFLESQLLPDEKVLFKTKKHLIVFLNPLLFTLLAMAANIYMASNPILYRLQYLPWLMAAILWLHSGLIYLTSEFAITNKRIYMREGFFFIHTNIMRLSAVVDVAVRQSLLGQALHYGSLTVNALGSVDTFIDIADPEGFKRTLTIALDKLSNHSNS
jgi:hypothetical protein